jgi:pimeloyl-ACP methyl ester carboxylesterase
MSRSPDALWVNVSPALRRFDRPLLNVLSRQVAIAEWQYYQTADEPTSLEVALVLLHDYVQKCVSEASEQEFQPLHLLGHGTGGLLAWLYARRYPERVRSLTLLSVGAYPAVDWQAHYYAQLQFLPCCREALLTQMVYTLYQQDLRRYTTYSV